MTKDDENITRTDDDMYDDNITRSDEDMFRGPPQDSLFESESEYLVQLDGNISISSDSVPNSPEFPTSTIKKGGHPNKKQRQK